MEKLTKPGSVPNAPGKLLLALAIAATTIWSFLVPDAPLFQRPELARIFFWHFPCPMLLTAFMFLGCYFSLRYFLRIGRPSASENDRMVKLGEFLEVSAETDPDRKRKWDLRAAAALEMGMIFAILTMVSGMIFSLAQWGALWQWDPRQTSFLIALLIYAAYFALRGAFSDPERRASHSGAYMLTACLPLVFLIFVFPYLPQIQAVSFHPTGSILKGQIKGQYAYVTIVVIALVSILSGWLYRMRVEAELLELKKSYGKLETSGDSAAPSAVVRPVRVPLEN
jgi:heme exporter protein C